MPLAPKAELRALLHARRNALAAEDRARFSESITRTLLALDGYRVAQTVMAYMSFGSEFLTGAFVRDVLRRGKMLVLPRIDRMHDRLEVHAVGDFEHELAAGPWGIPEPRPGVCPPVVLSAIDFILVPGLAFTTQCDRLGYGRGYYDRLLASRSPHTALVAAAFSTQIVPRMPTGAHDVPVDAVVTERETYTRAVALP